MGQSSFRGHTSVVSLAYQNLRIVRQFPGFAYARENGGAVWRGVLQPRESSPAYKVVVRYKIGKEPTVHVTWPKLMPGAPHLWPGGSLCLFWPKEWRWRRDEWIADTIIPWAALWLFYYELWLDTGEWLGPSSHRTVTNKGVGQHDAA